MSKRCSALLAAVFLFALPVRAWNSYGHEVVAAIAWEQLTPAARAEAVRLLASAPGDSSLPSLRPAQGDPASRDRAFFLAASHWADLVRDESQPQRRETYHHSPWHYVNFFWEQRSGKPFERADMPIAEVNVMTQLAQLSADLADPAKSDAERGLALAWLLHLVGDVHQPLHTSGRVTASEPEGDRGGNDFLFSTNDHPERNLHAYWDDTFSRENPGVTSTKTAQRLASKHPRPSFAESLTDDFTAWARGTFELVTSRCYPPSLKRGKPPGWTYRRMARRTAARQAALGGYRLAALLEARLGGELP